MQKVLLAIGAHIGDMELTCGGVLATHAKKGYKIVTVALTAGERGNPKHMTQDEYRVQKVNEAKIFAEMLGGEAIVFETKDGELLPSEEIKYRVAQLIRDYKPQAVFTHWKNSMHKDHANTFLIVNDAQFYAGVDIGDKVKGQTHYAPVYLCENWEDREDFSPYIYYEVSEEGYQLWKSAIEKHWFIMNSSSFKYYDYYTSIIKANGCLARKQYAQAFNIVDYQKKVVRTDF
ncbi:MAG: PIG-L family deacetylase [Erysipelotrichales bacterium]|nr:PIG-L family deacetylase [Erysipelotrichales bacterium]